LAHIEFVSFEFSMRADFARLFQDILRGVSVVGIGKGDIMAAARSGEHDPRTDPA
jgi:hypothetical protein